MTIRKIEVFSSQCQFMLILKKEAFVMFQKRVFIFIIGILIFLAGVAQAQVSGMTVAVDGMACPFCAYGVEKRLKMVKGVATVAVDMKTGTAKLEARFEDSIHYQEVPKAIKEAGFTAGAMQITISGSVETGKGSSFLIVYDGPELLLKSGDNKMVAHLRNLAGSGQTVVLHGVLSRKRAKNWYLRLESIREVMQ